MKVETLIVGATGQDGRFLTEKLLQQDQKVYATSRMTSSDRTKIYLEKFLNKVVVSNNWLEVLESCSIKNIYYLAGQSSVGQSYQQPREQFSSVTNEYIDLLEWIRVNNKEIKIFFAASGECFGDTSKIGPATEETKFNPINPYAYSKVFGAQVSKMYRELYQLNISIGYLFNHESKLRPEGFVVRKIIDAAKSIRDKKNNMLRLGNIGVVRDWGYAGDYVDAMFKIMQQAKLDDYVICTGKPASLYDFARTIFEYYDLPIDKYLEIDNENIRLLDAKEITGDPSKIMDELNWKPQFTYENLIQVIS